MTEHPNGFTLIELLVAMAITGMVLLMAHATFSGISETAARQRQALAEDASEAMTVEWMGAALRAAEIGRPEDGSFDGGRDAVAFTGYLPAPAGWPERRHIRFGLAGDELVMSGAGDAPLVLRAGVSDVAFDYLLEPGSDARWVSEWHSPVSVPLAVRVRLRDTTGVDTMLILIGSRG